MLKASEKLAGKQTSKSGVNDHKHLLTSAQIASLQLLFNKKLPTEASLVIEKLTAAISFLSANNLDEAFNCFSVSLNLLPKISLTANIKFLIQKSYLELGCKLPNFLNGINEIPIKKYSQDEVGPTKEVLKERFNIVVRFCETINQLDRYISNSPTISARALFIKALKNKTIGLFELTNNQEDQTSFNTAYALLQKALKIQLSPAYLFNLAEICIFLDKPDEALTYIKTASTIREKEIKQKSGSSSVTPEQLKNSETRIKLLVALQNKFYPIHFGLNHLEQQMKNLASKANKNKLSKQNIREIKAALVTISQIAKKIPDLIQSAKEQLETIHLDELIHNKKFQDLENIQTIFHSHQQTIKDIRSTLKKSKRKKNKKESKIKSNAPPAESKDNDPTESPNQKVSLEVYSPHPASLPLIDKNDLETGLTITQQSIASALRVTMLSEEKLRTISPPPENSIFSQTLTHYAPGVSNQIGTQFPSIALSPPAIPEVSTTPPPNLSNKPWSPDTPPRKDHPEISMSSLTYMPDGVMLAEIGSNYSQKSSSAPLLQTDSKQVVIYPSPQKSSESYSGQSQSTPCRPVPLQFTCEDLAPILTPSMQCSLRKLALLNQELQNIDISLALRGTFAFMCCFFLATGQLFPASDIDAITNRYQGADQLTKIYQLMAKHKFQPKDASATYASFYDSEALVFKTEITAASIAYHKNPNPFVLTDFHVGIILKGNTVGFFIDQNAKNMLDAYISARRFPFIVPQGNDANFCHFIARLAKYGIKCDQLLRMTPVQMLENNRARLVIGYRYLDNYFQTLSHASLTYRNHHFKSLVKMIEAGTFSHHLSKPIIFYFCKAFLSIKEPLRLIDNGKLALLRAAKNTAFVLQSYFVDKASQARKFSQAFNALLSFNMDLLANSHNIPFLVHHLQRKLNPKSIPYLSGSGITFFPPPYIPIMAPIPLPTPHISDCSVVEITKGAG